jgi:hypothetical protein
MCLLLAFEHCKSSANIPSLHPHFNLQKANSSNVRFAVSGNMNQQNTTSYDNHAT